MLLPLFGTQPFSHTMTGGAIAGGAASFVQGRVASGSGGGILGGSAVFRQGRVYSMAGGGVAGGAALIVLPSSGGSAPMLKRKTDDYR